jgi:hypothetical protein
MGGKIWDRIDADLHVLHHFTGIDLFVHLDENRAAAAAGGGIEMLDATDGLESLLDLQHDGFLGLIG